jgi:hypothetical protein
MTRRVTFALTVLATLLSAAAAGAPAAAQERFPVARRAGPTAWASLSVGLFQVSTMYDPTSNSDWDFGSIVQFRGSLEREIQRSASLGAVASFARAPLTYFGPECAAGCNADAGVWQALALFRIGGGGMFGLHQVIELEAGATGFTNFRENGGTALSPRSVVDPTFNLGYGFGYSFSPNTQLTVVQQFGLMVHRKGDRPNGDESNVPRTSVTRIGVRLGLGGTQ